MLPSATSDQTCLLLMEHAPSSASSVYPSPIKTLLMEIRRRTDFPGNTVSVLFPASLVVCVSTQTVHSVAAALGCCWLNMRVWTLSTQLHLVSCSCLRVTSAGWRCLWGGGRLLGRTSVIWEQRLLGLLRAGSFSSLGGPASACIS